MNHDQAARYVDLGDKENLRSGTELDLGSQQYDVVDRKANSKPIDVINAVVNIQLKAKGQ